jgi:outer membrane protein assembly factor BamB
VVTKYVKVLIVAGLLTSLGFLSCNDGIIPPPPPPSMGAGDFYPPDGSKGADVNVDLSWSDGGYFTFDVYFGTESEPPLVATDVPADYDKTEFDVGELEYETTYYWRVVAKHPDVDDYPSDIMSFTTTEEGRLIWKVDLSGPYGGSPSTPFISDGRIYVDGYHSVVCLEPVTGSVIWVYQAGVDVWNPYVEDGKVYVGGRDFVYCLSAVGGASIWSYETGYFAYGPPAIEKGLLFATVSDFSEYGNYKGYLICLNAASGVELWTREFEEPFFAAPLALDDMVIVGNGRALYWLKANTGELIWERLSREDVSCRPFLYQRNIYSTTRGIYLYCHEAATGVFNWFTTANGRSSSDPYAADGEVYGGYSTGVYCFDAFSGAPIWAHEGRNSYCSSPVVKGGKLYIGANEHIICLDAGTGNLIWEYLTGDYVYSDPALYDGRVYVSSADGYLYCLADELDAGSLSTVSPTTHRIVSEPASTGNKGSFDSKRRTGDEPYDR